ncbi:MAG: prolipoprotein diacylglyceryl transferase family protein, partial [Planctomycetota bacterium]
MPLTLPLPIGWPWLPALLLALLLRRRRWAWPLPLILLAMMTPWLPWLQVIEVPLQGLLIALGLSLAFVLWRRRTPQTERARLRPLAAAGLLGGVLGARLWYLVEFHRYVFEQPRPLLAMLDPAHGGMVLYGGLLGGLLGLGLAARYQGLPVLPHADRLAGPLCLALALGRLGCLNSGCCYGAATQLPWAWNMRPGHGW